MKISLKNDQFVDYIIVYLLLLFKAGFLFYELYSAISAILFLVLLLVVLWMRGKRIHRTQLTVVLVMIVCQILTCVFCGFPTINKFGLSLLNIITALLIVSIISIDSFSKYFSNIILLICGVSLVGHLLFISGIPLIHLLPTITNSHGHSVYFAGLAEFWMDASSGGYRLQGIFWEPGAFQAMIIIAAILDLYKNNPVKIRFRLLCYAVTLFFTYSTTGYICLLLFFILLTVKGRKMKASLVFIIVSLSLFIVVLVNSLFNRLEGFLYFSMFGKLELLVEAFKYGDSNAATSRVDSIILPFKYFLDSPIFGLGERGFDEIYQKVGHNMFTCTAVNYFAYYGVICGIICCIGFANYIRLKSKTFIEAFILIFILLITTGSENFAFNPIFTVFMLYGFVRFSTNKNKSIQSNKLSQ